MKKAINKRRQQRKTKARGYTALSVAFVAGLGLLGVLSDVRSSPAAPSEGTAEAALALRIRDAFSDDPVLQKLNLGVRVDKGVVTLQGPIPSRQVASQAVAMVAKMRGVTAVRDELYTPGPGDALARYLPLAVTTQRPPTPLEKSPPIIVSSPPPMPAQPVSLSLAQQIERIRDRDRRFADIRIEVKDGRVILRGTVRQSRDAWDFADQVGKLPGVNKVVQSVETRK